MSPIASCRRAELFAVGVGLIARVRRSESVDFHALSEDALYGWLSIKTAIVKHLRAREVGDEADVRKGWLVATTEPTGSRVMREHLLNDTCRVIEPVLKPPHSRGLIHVKLVLQIVAHARNHKWMSVDSDGVCQRANVRSIPRVIR